MKAGYTLLRHLASGHTVKSEGHTLRYARELAGRMLVDNGACGRAEAQQWATSLTVGERCDHESGRGVTILAAP